MAEITKKRKRTKDHHRGEVWIADAQIFYKNVGHLMVGRRPVLIISSEIGNRTSGNVIVLPLTSRIKEHSCNVTLPMQCVGFTLPKPTQVLCNHPRTESASSLIYKLGRISDSSLAEVEKALLLSVGIKK